MIKAYIKTQLKYIFTKQTDSNRSRHMYKQSVVKCRLCEKQERSEDRRVSEWAGEVHRVVCGIIQSVSCLTDEINE